MERIRNYYYNKLSYDEKICVKKIYKALQKFDKIVELDFVLSDIHNVIEAVKYTFPEFFYVDFFKVEYKLYFNKMKIKFNYLYTSDEISACNDKINKIVSKIDLSESKAMIETKIFNTIISHVSYDSVEVSKASNHDIYGAIMYRESVCEGMSLLFLYMCNKVGIDCTVVTGMVDGVGHMWNVIRIDDKLYNVDIVLGLNCIKNKIKYGGFNLPNNLLDYIKDSNIVCDSLDANPYYYNDMYFNNLGELTNKINHFLNKMDRVIFLNISNVKYNINDLVNGLGNVYFNVRFVLYDNYLIVEKY